MIADSAGCRRTVAFVDDAHTFGGTQIAMAWAIRAILRHSSRTIVCICTRQTRDRILPITREDVRLRFIECAPALPLNIFTFPLRLRSFYKTLAPLFREGIGSWWFNLAGIEFCLAPLTVLTLKGIKPVAWLHNNETFLFYNSKQSVLRRLVSRIRDAVADRFIFRLYPRIVTPSHATEKALESRFRSNPHPDTDFLYPSTGVNGRAKVACNPANAHVPCTINFWMINRVEYAQKNNATGLRILKHFRDQKKDATLTVVGDGPDLENLRQLSRDLHISEFVTFMGWAENPWQAVPGDAILLVPSFFESMSLVAREALLNEVRMVLSPLPVFFEYMPGALIARDFSVEAFAERIAAIEAMDCKEIHSLYAKALGKFSEKAFVEKFESLLPVRAVVAGVPGKVRRIR